MKTIVSPGASAPSRLHYPPELVCVHRDASGPICCASTARSTTSIIAARAARRRRSSPNISITASPSRSSSSRGRIVSNKTYRGVIRPDLILTDDGFVATELDSVPGGMGFVGAMAQAYCELGLESVGGNDGIAAGFAAMLRHATSVEHPTVAIVVSEESADYRGELDWLAAALRRLESRRCVGAPPQEIMFTEEALFIRHEDGREDRSTCSIATSSCSISSTFPSKS